MQLQVEVLELRASTNELWGDTTQRITTPVAGQERWFIYSEEQFEAPVQNAASFVPTLKKGVGRLNNT